MSTSNDPWTFTVGTTALTFLWLRQDAAGVPGRATWKQRARIVVRPYLGTGDADVASVGLTPWTISGQAYITPDQIGPFLSVNGRLGALTDGTYTWQAVLDADIQGLVYAEEDGGVLELVFTRARS
jgi:predicted Rdx family selenoprotein